MAGKFTGPELAAAYVSVSLSTGGLGDALKQQLGAAGDVAGKTAGEKSGKSLLDHLGGALKKGALTVGVTAGGILATALSKGWSRLTSIENAEASLSGLGHSAATVASIMDNALASVKGTAFGLDEAASVAASAVAAGIKPGTELEKTLRLVADAATIGGSSMTEMGAIFNKVAASNKVQGDVINQLNTMGIPIVQMLGKELNATTDDILGMSKKGKLSFEMFAKAMEDGLGGAALKSGATTQGAFKNMGAALSRFGAALAKPIFEKSKGVFGDITERLDKMTAAVGPLASKIGDGLSGAFDKISAVWPGLKTSPAVLEGLRTLGRVWESLKDTATKLWPSLKSIASSIADATKSLGVSAWGIFLGLIESTAGALQTVLVPAFRWVADFMKNNPALVAAAAAALLAYKVVTTGITAATTLWTAAQRVLNVALKANPIGLAVAAVAALAAGITYLWNNSEGFRNFFIGVWDGIKQVVGSVVDWFESHVLPVLVGAWDLIRKPLAALGNFFEETWNNIKRVFSGVIDFVVGIFTGSWTRAWDGIKQIFGGYWDQIKNVVTTVVGFITSTLGAAWNVIKDAASVAWEAIKSVITGPFNLAKQAVSTVVDGISKVLSGAWNGIKSAAQGAWGLIRDYIVQPLKSAYDWVVSVFGSIGSTISAAFNNVVSFIKTPINWVIEAINWVIRQLNKLSWDVPSWVPFIGGQHWGFNIGEIPLLAKGTDYFAGGSAIVGERGPELVNLPRGSQVVPTSKTMALMSGAATPRMMSLSVILDGRQIGRTVAPVIADEIRVYAGASR